MAHSTPAPLYILDDLIRKGHVAAARRELVSLAKRGLARDALATAAFFAWRLKLGRFGAALLNRIVRPTGRARRPATDEEKAVYAACLVQLGAIEEGDALLGELPAAGVPRALLFRASALVAKWDYAGAIPAWRAHIASPDTDAYGRLVGTVNLAAAHVFEREHAEADALVATLVATTRKEGHARLYCNARELGALSAMMQGHWAEAEASLAEAERGLGHEGGLDAFLLRKWRAMLRFLRDGASRPALAAMERLRRDAAALGHWETVRDVDRSRALVEKNERLLQRVYFGTPYESYRLHLLREFGDGATIPDVLVFCPAMSARPPRAWLDLATGRSSDDKPLLAPGETSHRLLAALCHDFYRPARAAALHARLYPDELYNPDSSPVRVRQAIRRLRSALRALRVPLSVVETDGEYRLAAKRPFGLLVGREPVAASRREGALDRLRQRWRTGAFSSRDAQGVLGKSERAARKLLERAVKEGELARSGRSVGTRYRFKG